MAAGQSGDQLPSFEKTVGIVTATLVLAGMLYKPVRSWWLGVSGRWLVRTIKRCAADVRHVLIETVLVREVGQIEKNAEWLDVNKNRLDFVEAAIIEHGKSLSVLPGLAVRMEGLPDAIETLSSTMLKMSENVGHIRGKMEERERRESQDREDAINRRRSDQGPPDGMDDRRHEERRRPSSGFPRWTEGDDDQK